MALTPEQIQDFNAFLGACTKRQIQGVYDKEREVGRPDYIILVEVHAMMRGIVLERGGT